MAIVWGAARGNFRLGIDLIDNGSSFTWIVYGESVAYGHNWSYTLSFSGSAGGSVTGSFYSAWGQTVRRELHRWNSPKQTYSVTATLNSVLVSGATVSRGITVTPKPAAPRIDRVVRNSDTSHRVEWTRNATATSVRLERRTNDGSWQHVSSVSSNAASITDTTTKAGNKYQYRVRVANAGGTSDWSNLSSTVYTTPAVPSVPTVARVGDDIRVNTVLPANASHAEFQDDGVGVSGAVAKASLPWTHTAPDPMVTHRYRARSRVMSGTENDTLLTSAYSGYSATVQLLAPPNPPSGLKPNGGVVDVEATGYFSWQHNPADSSEQTKFQVRGRIAGGAWSESAEVVSGASEITVGDLLALVGVTVTGGDVFEWQVRTWGYHADPSTYSATSSVTFIDQPVATIINPSPGTFYEARLTVGWAFFQAQGRSQSGWEVALLRDGQIVERREGTGSRTSYTFTTGLEDSGSYQVHVALATGDVWSQPETVEINVSFIPPLPGFAEGVWNEQTGAIDLEIFTRNDETYEVIVEPSGALAVEV